MHLDAQLLAKGGIQILEHDAFLKRNGASLGALLEAAEEPSPPIEAAFVDQLTSLIATDQVLDLLDGRTRRGLLALLHRSPPGVRAKWSRAEWAYELRRLRTVRPEAPDRLSRFYQLISARDDYPNLAAMRSWGQHKWRSLFAHVGCDAELAGTVSSLILDRREMPGGPLVRPLYGRMGYKLNEEGRPGKRDVFPEHTPGLKWGLARLAAKVCTVARQPGDGGCQPCPVRNFCAAYRSASASQGPATSAPTFVDVFSGGGGLSLGLTRAGLQLRVAVEIEQHAADTLYLNHAEVGEGVVAVRDIRELLKDEAFLSRHQRVDVLAGGPPCQPFSMARRHSGADVSDPRRTLFEAFVDMAQVLQPKVVVMENVSGILTADGGRTLEAIYQAFNDAGFVVGHALLNAAEFGVPQNRLRVFFIAANHQRLDNPDAFVESVLGELEGGRQGDPVTLQQAISGLPKLAPAEGGEVILKDTRVRGQRSAYSRGMSTQSPFIFNHEARPHNDRDIAIFAAMKPGETAEAYAQRSPPGGPKIPYQLDSFGDKYRKLHPAKPSPTIPAHLRRDSNSFIHPTSPRGLTAREAARLQSFPDDYIFLGGFGAAFTQIGNAVPPLLGEAVGRAVRKHL